MAAAKNMKKTLAREGAYETGTRTVKILIKKDMPSKAQRTLRGKGHQEKVMDEKQ